MANFREVFTNKHAVLPVIHVLDEAQVLKNAEIAYDEGADGVFLINMPSSGVSDSGLLKLHQVTREAFPNRFIGVNRLRLPAHEVFKGLNGDISGVWVDDARIVEDAERQVEAAVIQRVREESKWDGLYFGGVAFKYVHPEVSDYAQASKVASQFMDVVTTSGAGTGHAPTAEKIFIMKQAIGEKPLAIASGIKPENVELFKDNADAFLVASSLISNNATEMFERFRVRDLVSAVRGN